MGTIYARGKRLWIGFKDSSGQWVYRWSGYEVGHETQARALLEEIEAAIRSGADLPAGAGLPTVAQYAETWCSGRIGQGLSNAQRERGRLRKYLGALGPMRIDKVERRHVRAWLLELRAKTLEDGTRLAPRTIRSTYGILHSLFESAIEIYIDVSPCRLKKRELPKKADKDPAWRHTALFTRGEVEQLISDERVPFEDRVAFAIGFIGGTRPSEIGPLRWRHIEEREPMQCLHIVGSYNQDLNRHQAPKSGYAREVPVHPTLASVLAEWRLAGFPARWGRAPKPDDLVVSNLRGKILTEKNIMDRVRKYLPILGLRHRRFHDMRRTFTSMARAGGANKDVLRWVTHGPESEEIVDVYTSFPWPVLCDAVAKLQVGRLGGAVRELRAVGLTTRGTTVLGGTMERSEKTSVSQLNGVEAEGIEPAPHTQRGSPPRAVTVGSARPTPGKGPGRSQDRSNVVNRAAVENELKVLLGLWRTGAKPDHLAAKLDWLAAFLRRH